MNYLKKVHYKYDYTAGTFKCLMCPPGKTSKPSKTRTVNDRPRSVLQHRFRTVSERLQRRPSKQDTIIEGSAATRLGDGCLKTAFQGTSVAFCSKTEEAQWVSAPLLFNNSSSTRSSSLMNHDSVFHLRKAVRVSGVDTENVVHIAA